MIQQTHLSPSGNAESPHHVRRKYLLKTGAPAGTVDTPTRLPYATPDGLSPPLLPHILSEERSTRARELLDAFEKQDDTRRKVRELIATDRRLSRHGAVDSEKYPTHYHPTLTFLLELGIETCAANLRILHLGANHGVFCRMLQGLAGCVMSVALDRSPDALLRGKSWGLRQAVVADAIDLAVFQPQSFDIVLAESLFVPGYWSSAQIAHTLSIVARILRPEGWLLVQEWGFNFAAAFAHALAAAGFCNLRALQTRTDTQQGQRDVTCFVCGGQGTQQTH